VEVLARISEAARDWTVSEAMFDLAPVPLWLEDWSAVKALLSKWGLKSADALRAFLRADLDRAKVCAALMRVIKVNARTVALLGARDGQDVIDNLDRVFKGQMFENLIEELAQIWEGQVDLARAGVNYALDGRPIDVLVKARILPGYEEDWSRVLVSTEDVTDLQDARKSAQSAERYAQGLFDHSPVSLWVEDFSNIKALFGELAKAGIADLRGFLDVHPEFVDRCFGEVGVLDVNRETLRLFRAADKAELLSGLSAIVGDGMREPFRELLVELWSGILFQRREVVNYALDGTALHLHMQFSVLPGHEADWSRALIALTDITARKKAEEYLAFLGAHDALTKLRNRNFFNEEIARLDRKGPFPVTLLMIDLNGLKNANDGFGHAAGDEMLRRLGAALAAAVIAPNTAARIGGDEFAVILPGADSAKGRAVAEAIRLAVSADNRAASGPRVSVSVGLATSLPGERLAELAGRADAAMYAAKGAHYGTGRG